MAEGRGDEFVFWIEDPLNVGVFLKVGSARAVEMTFDGELVEVTDKDSQQWQKLLAKGGVKRMSVTLSGVFDGVLNADRVLESVSFNKTIFLGRIERGPVGSEDRFQGNLQAASYQRSGELEAELFTVQLRSAGVITFTPGPGA